VNVVELLFLLAVLYALFWIAWLLAFAAGLSLWFVYPPLVLIAAWVFLRVGKARDRKRGG
jgi:hypothetical protein